ncbi:MAG: RNA methyltransferase [Betaproteobacteria bacterium]|nr:RNA methyltransferase [Betaproteobacteria bacterium]
MRRWQRLAREARARREEGRALIEGPHLVAAYLDSGAAPEALIVSESGAAKREIRELVDRAGVAPDVLSDAVFGAIADAETPQGLAAEIVVPAARGSLADSPGCVLLDGIQDAGNVGAILRSAAAFGVRDVLLGAGCADPWSPKVLRAAMGAHFSLRIGASRNPVADVERFGGTVACTVARGGVPIGEADLQGRILWIFGGEGAGIRGELAARAGLKVTIPMPGTAESLNVAAAAAICFYEKSRQR